MLFSRRKAGVHRAERLSTNDRQLAHTEHNFNLHVCRVQHLLSFAPRSDDEDGQRCERVVYFMLLDLA